MNKLLYLYWIYEQTHKTMSNNNTSTTMIKKGDTIVYKTEVSIMFYWLCDIVDGYMVFFNWYSNPYKASSNDFWKMSERFFNEKVNEGKLEVYKYLPLDKYGDVFERQAECINN